MLMQVSIIIIIILIHKQSQFKKYAGHIVVSIAYIGRKINFTPCQQQWQKSFQRSLAKNPKHFHGFFLPFCWSYRVNQNISMNSHTCRILLRKNWIFVLGETKKSTVSMLRSICRTWEAIPEINWIVLVELSPIRELDTHTGILITLILSRH